MSTTLKQKYEKRDTSKILIVNYDPADTGESRSAISSSGSRRGQQQPN